MLADEDGSHAFAATAEQHEANIAAAAAAGVAGLIGRPTARFARAVIGSPGRALAVAGAPQRRLRGGGPRLDYVAFDVAGRIAARLPSTRCARSGSVGLSVTTPHKAEVAAAVDELAPAAAALRSVNTVVR